MTQQNPTPEPLKRKRRRVWPWLLAAVVVIIVIAAANSGSNHNSTTKPAAAGTSQAGPAPATPVEATSIPPLTAQAPSGPGKTIVYEVISDSTLSSVTYFDENSAEKQETGATAPWSKTVVNTSTYAIAGLGAQTNGQSITCRITVNGRVVDTKTSTGQYAVVNCTAPIS